MRPVDHFIKFFRQLPRLGERELTEDDWRTLLALKDRDAFRARVDECFPGLSESKRARRAQFLHDKHQELLREAGSSPRDSGTGDSRGGGAGERA